MLILNGKEKSHPRPIGKSPGQSSVLQLADAQRRTRLMLLVSPAGEATIQFKDEAVAVVRELKAEELSRAK